MKILFHYHNPFSLAHGGLQVQIEQTMAALRQIGVDVEPLRWWDPAQSGDVLQYFTRMPTSLARMAQRNGMKVVLVELMTEQGSRSRNRLRLQKLVTRLIPLFLPRVIVGYFNWDSYHVADACVALTPWEAHLIRYIFRAPADKVRVIPNGVEEVFLNSSPAERGKWLVCTAIITERKRVLELAEAAVSAHTPTWIIGKPYTEADPYYKRFLDLTKDHPETIRYEGAISDRAKLARIYRQARGFVLLSKWESLSLSALEAAACGCPLLLSDLPWANSHFGSSVSYCPVKGRPSEAAARLADFYKAAPQLQPPKKPASWRNVALMYKELYEELLNCSRS